MRSFILKSALAAILVSTSLVGGINAAGAASKGADRSSHESQSRGRADDSGYFDHMTMGPTMLPAPAVTRSAPVTRHVIRTAELKPRLAQITREVGVAHHRIAVDQSRGFLKSGEARVLQARAHDIRMDAVRTAENHRGALPKANYAALQSQVAQLNSEIHRDATT